MNVFFLTISWFGLDNEFYVQLAMLLLLLSIIIIILSLFVLFLRNKKTAEQKNASKIVSVISSLKKGKLKKSAAKDMAKQIEKSGKEAEKKGTTLKEVLIKKFQPKIESQLKKSIIILDFKAEGKKFVAMIELQGSKLELVLDSAGKIVDYKKLKS